MPHVFWGILLYCTELCLFTFKFPTADVTLIVPGIGPRCLSFISTASSHVTVKLQIKPEVSGHVHS